MIRKLFILSLSLFMLNCGDNLTYEQKIKNYNFCISKADSLIQIKDYKEAIAYSNTAIEITDTLAGGFIKKGYASYKLNWLDVAEENFDEAIKIEGDKSKAYRYRALVFLKMDDSDFVDDIDKYLSNYPDDDEAQKLRRDYFESKNDYNEAIEGYNIAIRKYKDSVELYVNRSEMYLKNKDYEEAMNDYNKILSMRPNSPEINSKKLSLENKLYANQNRNIFIGFLIGVYLVYLTISFLILKPFVAKKAVSQIGGELTVSNDPLVWVFPIFLLTLFIALYFFELIPNF